MYFRERAAVQVAKANEVRAKANEQRATTESAKAKAVSSLLQDMLRSANPDEVKDAQYTVRQLLDDSRPALAPDCPNSRKSNPRFARRSAARIGGSGPLTRLSRI
jgi:hypothetical protein